jgi:DNA processing protein
MARVKHWVWLSCISGVRPVTKYRLVEALGGADKVFFATREELLSKPFVTETEARHLADKSMAFPQQVMETCETKNIQIITLQDAQYPERLRNIPDPPVVLYVLGRLPKVDDEVVLGVVGTRRASAYGIKMAARFGRELAQGGAVVASGLAEGCDGAAMTAALEAGGRLIGVLGTAINQIYPAKNRALFAAVKRQGVLLSEYPPGMRTYPNSFIARNRILSGLSQGVIVVEAPLKSGTRNTAQHALEQGRDVFAVPGNADAQVSAGCNALLAEGAMIAADSREILARYGVTAPPAFVEKEDTPIKKEIDKQEDIVYIDLTAAEESLPSVQRCVLRAMTRPDMLADEITEAAGVTPAETLMALTMLQVAGLVAQGTGKRYTRKL